MPASVNSFACGIVTEAPRFRDSYQIIVFCWLLPLCPRDTRSTMQQWMRAAVLELVGQYAKQPLQQTGMLSKVKGDNVR